MLCGISLILLKISKLTNVSYSLKSMSYDQISRKLLQHVAKHKVKDMFINVQLKMKVNWYDKKLSIK